MRKINIDTRLVGQTAENVFLSLLNQRGVFATAFDTQGFDGIVFDDAKRLFKAGRSPFYVQIKCRGSPADHFNPQGHSPSVFEKMRSLAQSLSIEESSLYFVVGFFRRNDIRTLVFFAIPLDELDAFKSKREFRFSVKKCREVMSRSPNIFEI